MLREIPLITPSIPSVTRNDGMRTFTAMRPLRRPAATPTPTAASAPARNPAAVTTCAATSDDSATTEPTERSISAAASANVIPTAITAIGAAWRPMFSRLAELRNPSSCRMMAKAARMRANAR